VETITWVIANARPPLPGCGPSLSGLGRPSSGGRRARTRRRMSASAPGAAVGPIFDRGRELETGPRRRIRLPGGRPRRGHGGEHRPAPRRLAGKFPGCVWAVGVPHPAAYEPDVRAAGWYRGDQLPGPPGPVRFPGLMAQPRGDSKVARRTREPAGDVPPGGAGQEGQPLVEMKLTPPRLPPGSSNDPGSCARSTPASMRG
jgi:hypothetical protein